MRLPILSILYAEKYVILQKKLQMSVKEVDQISSFTKLQRMIPVRFPHPNIILAPSPILMHTSFIYSHLPLSTNVPLTLLHILTLKTPPCLPSPNLTLIHLPVCLIKHHLHLALPDLANKVEDPPFS